MERRRNVNFYVWRLVFIIACVCLPLASCVNDPEEAVKSPADKKEWQQTGVSLTSAYETTEGSKESEPIDNTTDSRKEPDFELSTGFEQETDTIVASEPTSASLEPVIINNYSMKPLYPAPQLKEMLMIPNNAGRGSLTIRPEGELMEPQGFAAINASEFVILDNVSRTIKYYRNSKFVQEYAMIPGEFYQYIDTDGQSFITFGNQYLHKVNFETGLRTSVPYSNNKEKNGIAPENYGFLVWKNDQLILNGMWRYANYCFDFENDTISPTENGYIWDPHDWKTIELGDRSVVWCFEDAGFRRIKLVYIDRDENLYITVWDSKKTGQENERALQKYNAAGELLWSLDLTERGKYHVSESVKYCRDGNIYYMAVHEEESIIYQIIEQGGPS